MFEMDVVRAWNVAIACEKNWKPTGPRWTYIDSDMYMAVMPINADMKCVDKFYRLFNDLADSFKRHYPNNISYAEWTADKVKIEAEYRELFGMAE